MTLAWTFLSGIEANTTGTGQFMQHLEAAVLARGKFDGTIVYASRTRPLTAQSEALLAAVPHLVVFHPQMLGVTPTLALLKARVAAGRVTHLYMLDNFFFCLKSYNHIPPETGPCFRCLGEGKGVNAAAQGCIPWPAADDQAANFIATLAQLVRAGHVHLFAQNRRQEEFARAHFGPDAAITYAGLWCADWTEYVDAFLDRAFLDRGEPTNEEAASDYDVVYHGSRDAAKGLGWVLSVAERTPELHYLAPIDRGLTDIVAPANVTVKAMRWESGLANAVRRAPLVLAPSLWSSPCEGALIKNIVLARAAGVVDIPSAFSSEVPGNVVLKLPADPHAAANSIRVALAAQWRPDPTARRRWVEDFRRANVDVITRLLPQA